MDIIGVTSPYVKCLKSDGLGRFSIEMNLKTANVKLSVLLIAISQTPMPMQIHTRTSNQILNKQPATLS